MEQNIVNSLKVYSEDSEILLEVISTYLNQGDYVQAHFYKIHPKKKKCIKMDKIDLLFVN